VLREPLERELVLREPPDRDEVDREDEEREPLEREPPERDVLDVPDLPARVAAPLRAAVLRLAAVRLRVAAPFLAAAERDLELLPPRTLLSSSSAKPRSSSTAPRISFGEFSPASAIARATRFRIPLARSLLNRSLSSDAFAIPFLLHRGLPAGRISTRMRQNLRSGVRCVFVKGAD